jgi:hypothetical protein
MSRYTWRPGSDDPLASCHGYRHDYRHHHRSTTGSPYCGRSCCGYRRPSCGICGTPFPQQIPPYVSTAGGAGVGVCPSWRRRRVDHGAWAAVGEGVPEVGLSGTPVTATPKRRCRTHPCSWRGQLLVVLLGCSPYCRALVRALAHVTGALTAVIRCPDGSRHGQTGGVAWRRGGGLRLPSTASTGPLSCRSHRFERPLRRRRPQGRSTRLLTIAASFPREDVPAWQGLLVEGGKAAECSWVSLPAWWWGSGVDVVDAPRPQGASHRGRAHVECPVQVAEQVVALGGP